VIVDGHREIRHVLYPISDPVASMERAPSMLPDRHPQRTRIAAGS
jgi:hypothetical protein